MDDVDRPNLAFGLSLASGALIFIEGVLILAVASAADSLGLTAAGSVLGGLGFIGVFLGFIVLVLSGLLYLNPDAHTGYGVAILVFSLVSYFGGGGFLIGLILGLIGGVAAIMFTPSGASPWWNQPQRTGQTRTCTMCEIQVPWEASHCPNCGRSMVP